MSFAAVSIKGQSGLEPRLRPGSSLGLKSGSNTSLRGTLGKLLNMGFSIPTCKMGLRRR